jgi:Arc/MetJ-type ribon-helix-helix transcriptional regulator
MSQSNTLNITLSEEALCFVRSKVSSGEYATESDVILDGLETLGHLSEEQRRWEQEVLMPGHDRLMADLSTGLTVEEVERNLEISRRQRLLVK